MNLLLYGFYQFLKLIVRTALRIFYPYKIYIGADRLRFDYPAILVSNHPNTLIDPLTVAAKTRKLVFFLANAGLFKSRFGHWFFNTFYCIPVQRPQDKGTGNKISNEDSFSRANDHLTGGGVLYIAPEGTSEMERRLRPLKTGTARIALSTEKKNNYELGMAIVPVGLTYYRPDKCGSRVVVKVGKPIYPQQYREAYEANPVKAVRGLTADLENRLAGLLIDTRDETEDAHLRLLEAMIQQDEPLAGRKRFEREMTLLTVMRREDDQELRQGLEAYRALLETHRIRDWVVHREGRGSLSPLSLLAVPVYVYGLINNYLAVKIPVWVSNKLGLYEGYTATVKILTGLLSIPLFYWLQTKMVSTMAGTTIAWAYLISLPLSALFYWRLVREWRRVEIRWRYRRLESSVKEELVKLRSIVQSRWRVISS